MPCKQTVRITYDKDKNPTKWELQCSDKCPDNTDCKPNEDVTDAKTGSSKEYCACKGSAVPDCHIVLYRTRKRPKSPVVEYSMGCEWNPANACPAGKKCIPVAVGNHVYDDDKEKLEWMEFECLCQPEDEAWPER